MNWKNTVTIITGAGSGIGKATSDLLMKEGGIVYNLDLCTPDIIDPYFIKCDVSNRDDIASAVNEVFIKEGKIDYVFSNAGVHLFATLEETSFEQMESVVSINIFGTFYLLKSVIPIMKKQMNGSIVLMGSDQALVGKASSSVYGFTKGAIGQLTKSTAIDYAPFNIRVNCVCPGTIQTPLLDRAVAQFSIKSGINTAEVFDSLNSVQPLGRIGRPEEIAKTVMFLLSDDSSFTTGSLVSVDGGYVCQ